MLITTRYSRFVQNMDLLERCLAIADQEPVVRNPPPKRQRILDRLSRDVISEIVHRSTREHASVKSLAEHYQLSEYSIRMVLGREGVVGRHSRIPQPLVDRARALCLEGMSDTRIAQETGLARGTIRVVVADLRHKA